MKRKYLVLLFLTIGIFGFSQTLTLLYKGKELANNEIIYADSYDANLGYIKAFIGVKNTDRTEVEVSVTKNPISVIDNSSNLFCWGIYCYSPSVTESRNPVKIPARSIDDSFYAEYVPANLTTGESVIEYKFYELNNTSNSASVVVHFVENQTGINKLQNDEFCSLSSIYNTGTIKVSCNLTEKSTLIIQNLSGKKIDEYILPLGFSTQYLQLNLSKGLYIYSILRLNKNIINKKFINY